MTVRRVGMLLLLRKSRRCNLLLQGEGKNEGFYQVWKADESGQVVDQNKGWVSPDRLERKVYGSSFGDVARGNSSGHVDTLITGVDIIASF